MGPLTQSQLTTIVSSTRTEFLWVYTKLFDLSLLIIGHFVNMCPNSFANSTRILYVHDGMLLIST